MLREQRTVVVRVRPSGRPVKGARLVISYRLWLRAYGEKKY
jgi:hypothetical protein